MLKKIKQRTLEKAIDRLLNVSIGIMGVGGLGFFVGQEGLSKLDSFTIMICGLALFVLLLIADHIYLD